MNTKTRDTSSHKKLDTAPTFGMSGIKNNMGISNPESTMPPANYSIKHGEERGKYMPDVMDHDGQDFVPESKDSIDKKEDIC